jgi:hypothetical protein
MARKLQGGRPLTRYERLLPWLALVAYLAAGCLGGWSLHRETAACRCLARAEVVRRVAELADKQHAEARAALRVVRGGAR